MATPGLTTIRSSFGPQDTMNRLETAVKAKGMTVFARIDHAAGAEVPLLARLEHEDDVAGEVVARRTQQLRRADEGGHVQVVTAGVHRAVHLGPVREVDLLVHG